MKELKEFTVERLERMHESLKEGLKLGFADALILRDVVKIALAAKRAKVVAYADKQAFLNFSLGVASKEWMWANKDKGLQPLYTTPPLNHTEQHMVVPDGWVSIPKEMLADYRDVKNSELQSYKASFGSHCDIPRSRWQRDLADLTEELAEIDKLIAAAPKPESE